MTFYEMKRRLTAVRDQLAADKQSAVRLIRATCQSICGDDVQKMADDPPEKYKAVVEAVEKLPGMTGPQLMDILGKGGGWQSRAVGSAPEPMNRRGVCSGPGPMSRPAFRAALLSLQQDFDNLGGGAQLAMRDLLVDVLIDSVGPFSKQQIIFLLERQLAVERRKVMQATLRLETVTQAPAVFNEWMRRFTEEPEKYESQTVSVLTHLRELADGKEPSYGQLCVATFAKIAKDLGLVTDAPFVLKGDATPEDLEKLGAAIAAGGGGGGGGIQIVEQES